jgi:hypothetical protein
MGMRRLRYVFAVCGAGALMAVAVQAALAASEHTPSSGAHAKAGTPSAAHRSANRAHPKGARPAPHKTTGHQEHKKDVAVRPATGPVGPADKSLERRPLLGPFSFGVETDPKVKPRSLAGGEADPERDPTVVPSRQGFRPSFLGLSLKSEFSW